MKTNILVLVSLFTFTVLLTSCDNYIESNKVDVGQEGGEITTPRSISNPTDTINVADSLIKLE